MRFRCIGGERENEAWKNREPFLWGRAQETASFRNPQATERLLCVFRSQFPSSSACFERKIFMRSRKSVDDEDLIICFSQTSSESEAADEEGDFEIVQGIVISDFRKVKEGQLSLMIGERIVLLHLQDNEWGLGDVQGQIGFFPLSCCCFDKKILEAVETWTKLQSKIQPN